jgi:hypothetical protein
MVSVLLALFVGLVTFVLYSYLTRRTLPDNPKAPQVSFDWPLFRHWPRFFARRHLKLDGIMQTMKDFNAENFIR